MDNHYILVLVLVSLCLICGCTSSPTGAGDSSGSIHEITDFDSQVKYTFEEAMDDIDYLVNTGVLAGENVTVYQINGAGVDVNGSATSWILGIREKGEVLLLTYGKEGWDTTPWIGPLPEVEIDLDTLVSPTVLYETQRGIIEDKMNQTEVSHTDVMVTKNT